MKKFLNSPETLLEESLDGFVAAHADIVVAGDERKFIRRKILKPGKVALISGGGSGHEPLHAGFVGLGMLDAACPGQIFTSPTPDQMVAAVEAVDQGAGVILIVKNYEGDVMNFEMAAEMTEGRCAIVVTDDDVAVETSTYSTGRRGVARHADCREDRRRRRGNGGAEGRTSGARAASEQETRSMGVASRHVPFPPQADRISNSATSEVEMGVGIHGEPGRRRIPLRSAREMVEEMVNAILIDLAPKRGAEAILFVNGFGATPLIELYLLYHEAARILGAAGVKPARSLVGSYVTSLDMAGASITVSMLQADTTKFWDDPVHTAALRWGA